MKKGPEEWKDRAVQWEEDKRQEAMSEGVKGRDKKAAKQQMLHIAWLSLICDSVLVSTQGAQGVLSHL